MDRIESSTSPAASRVRSASHEPAAIAGVIFVASWVAGLLIFAPSTDVRSSGAALLVAYRGHEFVAALQFVLTEGIPAGALAVVVYALARVGPRGGDRRFVRAVKVCGMTAVVVSLVECALGLQLTMRLLPAHRAGPVAAAFDAITRLDGLKMFLLAGLALAGRSLIREGRVRMPHWLAVVALAVSTAIATTGIGYLLLLNGPALAAWVSLPLLLVWVCGVGLSMPVAGDVASQVAHSGRLGVGRRELTALYRRRADRTKSRAGGLRV